MRGSFIAPPGLAWARACYRRSWRNDPALIRLSGPEAERVRPLSVMVHPDVERFGRVKAVIEWLQETLTRACDVSRGGKPTDHGG